MQDFRNLEVWWKAHRLTLDAYEATAGFPQREAYGLTSQFRRSCASIPSNLAEGCGRSGDRELARFAQIAMGSASELEYHLLLARDLGYLDTPDYEDLSSKTREAKRMLSTLITRLRTSQPSRQQRTERLTD